MKKVFFVLLALVALTCAALLGDSLTLFQVGMLTLASAPILVGGSDSHKALAEAREKAGRLAKQMDDLNKQAMTEKRELTSDEDQKWNRMEEDLTKFEKEIRRLEKAIEIESRLVDFDRNRADDNKVSADELRERSNAAFRNWLRGGLGILTAEERTTLDGLYAGDAASGGYTVPEGFMMKLEVAMKAFGGIYGAAAKFPTTTGNDVPFPTVNDTANSGEIIGENTSVGTSVDPTFAAVTFKSFTYSSKPILISNVLLQDTAFDLENRLAEMMAERIMRALAANLATGNGTAAPQGLVTGAANSSISGVAAAAITFDNLIDLMHSVDPNYRANGTWVFNDATLKALRKIKDGELRPIWQGNYEAGAPGTILGRPYVIAHEIADIGASAKSILFGDLSKYMVREVAGGQVKRLVERYADYNMTGYLLFKRFDARLIDAGTNPVKYIAHPAT